MKKSIKRKFQFLGQGNWRVYLVFFLFLSAGLTIIFRLYHLQIEKGDHYEALALGQQITFEQATGNRGDIFLKNSDLALAQLKKKSIVYAFPKKVPDAELENTIEILVDVLNQEKQELISLFLDKEIFRQEVSENQLQRIEQENLEGIYTEELLSRFYPQETLACHIVGFVNQDGEGQYGVEGYYNEQLSGDTSLQKKVKSPFGYLTMFFNESNNSVQGSSLLLTFDYNIQYFAEKLLIKAKNQWDIDSGQIIVADPKTGKILAMADFPQFNLNDYSKEQDMNIFKNNSTQKLFEPGSVFKPITMAAALDADLVKPETIYEDKGFIDVGGPRIYNFEKRIWGEQTMTDVLEESINTGAVFIQQELGPGLFLDYLDSFGLFEKTDIDMQGEVFSNNTLLKRGYARDLATASFGQGVEITPIQLIKAFGAIANNGILMKPYVVEKIIEPNNKETIIEPKEQGRAISKETSAKLSSMLVSVVEQGSGRRAQIDGYYIAGKTGTAQVIVSDGGYSESKSIQSFIGYFPALNPEILILIKLDNPDVKTAAYSAAPLFYDLAKHIIGLYQIPPDH